MGLNSTKRSNLELWKFLFVIAYIAYNFYLLNHANHPEINSMLFSGGKVLEFFFIIAGFSLMSFCVKNSKNDVSTWEYLKGLISRYYPALLGGVFLAFVVRNFVIDTSLVRIPSLLVGAIFELLGLSQLGIASYSGFSSNSMLQEYIVNGGITPIWNEPLCYLSAFFIVSLIFYYIISKNRNLYENIIAPLVIVIGYSAMGMMSEFSLYSTGIFGIPNAIIRVAAGMALGSLIYRFIDYLKSKEIDRKEKIGLTVLYFVFAIYFIVTTIIGIEWNEFINLVFIVPFVIILLLNRDGVSSILKSRFFSYLGSLALYVFACHIAFCYLIPFLFPDRTYQFQFLIFLIITLIWGNIMLIFDKFVITPLFRERKSAS